MAHRWEAPFDPAERKDFTRDWSDEMAASQDTIATVAFALPAEAAAAGLAIATSYQLNGVLAVVWLQAADPAAFLAAFEGKDVEISHTITTSSNRILHETCVVRVRQK